MGIPRSFFQPLHGRTKREYLPRMLDDKVHCMRVAKRYGEDYWDGDRRYGYGGYRYDGRWKSVARAIADTYGLTSRSKVLDVGCGKAHLLHEIGLLLPGIELHGIDVSEWALSDAPEAIRSRLRIGRAQDPLPFATGSMDLVLSLGCLHNLKIHELKTAFSEIQRVGKAGYFLTESYRDELELFNLQCWALTCQSFHSTDEWEWIMAEFGYRGDHEFIFFE
jgi:SAM-dependent methyltransferase